MYILTYLHYGNSNIILQYNTQIYCNGKSAKKKKKIHSLSISLSLSPFFSLALSLVLSRLNVYLSIPSNIDLSFFFASSKDIVIRDINANVNFNVNVNVNVNFNVNLNVNVNVNVLLIYGIFLS